MSRRSTNRLEVHKIESNYRLPKLVREQLSLLFERVPTRNCCIHPFHCVSHIPLHAKRWTRIDRTNRVRLDRDLVGMGGVSCCQSSATLDNGIQRPPDGEGA